MIGFEMTGRSKYDFSWRNSPWTEGSLLFLKLAVTPRKLPALVVGAQPPRGRGRC